MKKLVTSIALLSALTANAPFASADMIETVSEASLASPFMTADGQPLEATLVQLSAVDSQTVEATPVEVTEDGVRAHSTMSIRVSAPQVVSASWGVIFGTKKCIVTENGSKDDCSIEGFLVQIEPGLGGLKGSAGIAKLSIDSDLRGMMDLPISGIDLKASVLRTWGYEEFAAKDQTYAGIEADVNVSLVKFTLGLLKKLEGTGPDYLLTGGVGVGF